MTGLDALIGCRSIKLRPQAFWSSTVTNAPCKWIQTCFNVFGDARHMFVYRVVCVCVFLSTVAQGSVTVHVLTWKPRRAVCTSRRKNRGVNSRNQSIARPKSKSTPRSRCIHTEPGQAAEHVHKERACMGTGATWTLCSPPLVSLPRKTWEWGEGVSIMIHLQIQRLYMILTVFWNSTGMSTAISW